LHLFVAAGVTTERDVGDFTEWIVPLATRTKAGEIVGPTRWVRAVISARLWLESSPMSSSSRGSRTSGLARSGT
jgi:hypothetical protein